MPAQPGVHNHRSASHQEVSRICSPNIVVGSSGGPAQPGLKNLDFSANSAVAMRSPLPVEHQCVHGTHTLAQLDQGTPALPD
eukprot:5173598-Amphidinium_carterae.1